ncbi:putative domain HDIG-containing protein [Desulfosporosinus acidiphilus SJ4]|uniref:Putative domain HDIG-containing protein n=1 Tax=Desulfosporosinus acidiphilus (strain DSM 22704 / JCM 16185 / SJ4) TaxID=646529 RepID=I4D8C3_DESAJ|nr:HD domain-containing protein [Desulfosporosinus acidiphilus]AFM42047.1 putative domain HDIG-containing protein [Desulfosporosinus acidiphilus SJ4]
MDFPSSQEMIDQVVQIAKGFYARKDRAHDLEHALRVRNWGKKIALAEGADVTVIELAALLHDIGRSGAVEKTHAQSSAGLAVNILHKAGYSEDLIARVKEAIIAHSREAGYEPETLEAKILYDADKLDFVGAIGLGRLFTLGGVQGWPIMGENSCESFYQERIQGYQEHLFTKTALTYFKPLFLYMEEFWRQLHSEMI